MHFATFETSISFDNGSWQLSFILIWFERRTQSKAIKLIELTKQKPVRHVNVWSKVASTAICNYPPTSNVTWNKAPIPMNAVTVEMVILHCYWTINKRSHNGRLESSWLNIVHTLDCICAVIITILGKVTIINESINLPFSVEQLAECARREYTAVFLCCGPFLFHPGPSQLHTMMTTTTVGLIVYE